jgi:tetratricopeptide (TPR) repeat protein
MTLQLAKEYIKLQDWDNAYRAARTAETMDPGDIVVNLLRIETGLYIEAQQTAINKDNLVSLADDLAQLSAKHPKRVDIRILQAIVAEYLGLPEEAEEKLKRAVRECEEPLQAELQLASFYNRNGRLPEATDTCRRACERHPEAAQPWILLSNLYMNQQDYDSARQCLKQAQQNVVGKWEHRSISISLAWLELQHGEREAGIRLLQEVAEQDKREVRARTLLLSIPEIRQDNDKAQALIKELIKIEGDTGLMWRLHEAAVWLESDQWRSKQQDIINNLQHCIDLDPEWSAPYILLAEMYEKLEDFEHLEETYRQALIRNPSAMDIVDRLVTFLEKQGRFSEAEELLRDVGADRRASALRIQAYLREGNLDSALDELKLRISSDRQDANSRILLARLIYWRDQDKEAALRHLDEAEAIEPNTLAVTAARLAILKAEGQTEQARQILDDYVTNNGHFQAYMMRALYMDIEGDFDLAELDYVKLTTFADAEQGAMGYELLSDFYFRNEKYDRAVQVLDEALSKYRGNSRLKRKLMHTLFAQSPVQDQQRALTILSELEEHLQQDPELLYLRALQILNESPQSVEEAKEKLKDVVKLEPSAAHAYHLLISILIGEKDYESARAYAIRAIGSNPNNSALLLARSRAEIELDNIRMAVQLARAVLQNEPNSGRARDMILLAALKGENNRLTEEAKSLIQSAASDNPIDENLLLAEVNNLVEVQEPPQPGKAIPLLEAYCQTKMGNSSIDALVTLADLYRLCGDMDNAARWIEKAQSVDPDNQAVVHSRFLWMVAQKRFEELDNISSAYISATHQNPILLMKAASILIGLDSTTLKKEGLKIYQHIETTSPESITERLNVASTLYQKGDAEKAKAIYQELLQKYPNNIRILNDLAWILQEHYRRYTDALELANKGLQLAADNDKVNLLDTRGTILSNMTGRLSDATKDFETLLQLLPLDDFQGTVRRAKTLLKLGRICIKLDNIGQARRHFNEALEIDQELHIDIFTPDEISEIRRVLQTNRTQAANR